MTLDDDAEIIREKSDYDDDIMGRSVWSQSAVAVPSLIEKVLAAVACIPQNVGEITSLKRVRKESLDTVEKRPKRHRVAHDDMLDEMLGKAGRPNPINEVPDMESAFLCAMLEEAVYTEISETYCNYCETRGIEPPPRGHAFKIKADEYGQMLMLQPWVRRFRWFITGKPGMVQCKTDKSLLTKHDKNGKLILWAVTFIDEVVYGGSQSETNDLKNQAVGHVNIVEIGKLDMHLGVHNSLEAGEYTSYFGYSIAQYMAKMYSTEAIHVKHAANIYNETFHPTIGEVRPY
jgi:hypothetical protein